MAIRFINTPEEEVQHECSVEVAACTDSYVRTEKIAEAGGSVLRVFLLFLMRTLPAILSGFRNEFVVLEQQEQSLNTKKQELQGDLSKVHAQMQALTGGDKAFETRVRRDLIECRRSLATSLLILLALILLAILLALFDAGFLAGPLLAPHTAGDGFVTVTLWVTSIAAVLLLTWSYDRGFLPPPGAPEAGPKPEMDSWTLLARIVFLALNLVIGIIRALALEASWVVHILLFLVTPAFVILLAYLIRRIIKQYFDAKDDYDHLRRTKLKHANYFELKAALGELEAQIDNKAAMLRNLQMQRERVVLRAKERALSDQGVQTQISMLAARFCVPTEPSPGNAVRNGNSPSPKNGHAYTSQREADAKPAKSASPESKKSKKARKTAKKGKEHVS